MSSIIVVISFILDIITSNIFPYMRENLSFLTPLFVPVSIYLIYDNDGFMHSDIIVESEYEDKDGNRHTDVEYRGSLAKIDIKDCNKNDDVNFCLFIFPQKIFLFLILLFLLLKLKFYNI